MTTSTPDPTSHFRFPGVLNSKELLVAEAIQARAWQSLQSSRPFGLDDETEARDLLGRIVIELMSERQASVTELAAAATSAFESRLPSAPAAERA